MECDAVETLAVGRAQRALKGRALGVPEFHFSPLQRQGVGRTDCCRGDGLAVGAERQAGDPRVMDGMLQDRPRRDRIQDHNRAVGSAQHQTLSVRAESQAVKGAGQAPRIDRLSAGAVPQTELAAFPLVARQIADDRGDCSPARPEGYRSLRASAPVSEGEQLRVIECMQIIPFPTAMILLVLARQRSVQAAQGAR